MSAKTFQWLVVVLWLVGSWGSSAFAQLRFRAVDKSVIEERFGRNEIGNAKRAEELVKLFLEVGCPEEHLTLQKLKRSRHPNVICTLPGMSKQRIVVGAHFDAVPRSSGAVDNWSGAALLPSLYYSLGEPPRRHTLVFIGFTDEEKGRIGSKYFVDHLTDDAESEVLAMVNLDTLGLSPTKIWATTANPGLVEAIGEVAKATKLPVSVTNIDRVGNTDSTSFSENGIPAITLHSVTQKTLRIIHTPRDRPKALHLDWYYDTFRLTAAFLVYLDEGLE